MFPVKDDRPVAKTKVILPKGESIPTQNKDATTRTFVEIDAVEICENLSCWIKISLKKSSDFYLDIFFK